MGSMDEMVCSPSSVWDWMDWLSLFLSVVIIVAVFLFSLCVTPTLFVLFASVFALLSTRYRYLSIRFSVFRFYSSAVLFSPRVLLRSVYCAERVGPSSSSTYTDSFPPCSPSTLPPPLVPDRRATAYRTYVFSPEV